MKLASLDMATLSHAAHELICRFIEQTGRNHDSSARFELHPTTFEEVVQRAGGAPSLGFHGMQLLDIWVHKSLSTPPNELQFIPYVVTPDWRKTT
jgi:hypothetical protein